MDFMEILWKSHGIPIEKAPNALDELMEALGVKGSRILGISTRELREKLQEWGEETETREPGYLQHAAQPKTKEQQKIGQKLQSSEAKRKKRSKEKFEAEEFDEPIYPSKKDKKEWEKRGRPSNLAEAKRWEKQIRRKRRPKKEEERMIDGKPTKVTPIVSMKKPFTNPQSGPVTEEQKVPEWVYIDNEDVDKSILKSSRPMIFWTSKSLRPPQDWKRQGRMLGHKPPRQKLNNPSFLISALRELKNGDKERDGEIDKLIELLNKKFDKKRTTSKDKEHDPYTVTGKPGTKELRNYNQQETVLDNLLELLDKGYKYENRVDLQREVAEQKILSSKYLALISQDLFSDTKNIHPRIIDRLKKPRIYRQFIKFLNSQNKNLPRESSFRSALLRLDRRKTSHSKIIDMLLHRPEDYTYKEELYESHLEIVNSFVTKNMKKLRESLYPLVNEGMMGVWDNTIDKIKSKYDKLSANRKKETSIEEFEGKEIINIIKDILEDVKELKEAQEAKTKLIEIGQNNGKSGTIDNTKYDIIMENFGILKESYYWNKYIDEAQRNTIEQPSKKDTKKPSSNQPNKLKEVQRVYRDMKKQLYNQQKEVKRLKKELAEQNTDMQQQWDKAQKERDSRYVSEADRIKKRLTKARAVLGRLKRSLDGIEEKYSEFLGEKEE